jgi:glycosyltransferase involved in cell wall biosynthesis
MRVLHVIPSVALVRGGPSQAILEMVKSLREKEIDAEIVTTNDNGIDLLPVTLLEKIDYQQVPVRFFPRYSPNISALREFAFSGALTLWLWQNIANYDLLHIHAIFSYASTIAMAIARYKKMPYIVRPVGLLCTWSLQQSTLKKQIYLSLIERQNLNGSSALHFTSSLEEQETGCLQLKASQKYVVPEGLNCPPLLTNARQRLRQSLNLPEDEPILLFLSRLHPKKGLDYLIAALSQLSQHRFTLVLAGRGDIAYEQELGKLVEQLGLTSRVRFAGFVAGEMKDLMFQGADLFVLTSHSESFGIAVIEALAAGLPVLTTPGVAMADQVQIHHLGWVVPLEVEAIALALHQFLLNSQTGNEMRLRAREFILKNYSWDKIAADLSQIYSTVLMVGKS